MTLRPIDELPYVEITDDSGVAERIYADAWVSEGIDLNAAIPQVPVESNARVADHYILEPVAFECTMFFSSTPIRGDLDPEFRGEQKEIRVPPPVFPNNTPLLSPRGLTKAVGGAISAGLGAVGLVSPGASPYVGVALRFEQNPNRLRKVLEKLTQARTKRQLVAVGSSILRIENLGITRIHLGRTADDGAGGAIDLAFEQMTFVQTIQAEAAPLPIEPRAQKKKASVTGGSDVTATPKGQTLAAKGFDAIAGALGQ